MGGWGRRRSKCTTVIPVYSKRRLERITRMHALHALNALRALHALQNASHALHYSLRSARQHGNLFCNNCIPSMLVSMYVQSRIVSNRYLPDTYSLYLKYRYWFKNDTDIYYLKYWYRFNTD